MVSFLGEGWINYRSARHPKHPRGFAALVGFGWRRRRAVPAVQLAPGDLMTLLTRHVPSWFAALVSSVTATMDDADAVWEPFLIDHDALGLDPV